MKFVIHRDKEVTELYLLDDDGKILLTDSVPNALNEVNEDILLQVAAGKMVKWAIKQEMIKIEEISDTGVKTLKYVSKKAELNEDFK